MANYKMNYFNFKEINGSVLLTNDTGRFVFIDKDIFHDLLENRSFDNDEILTELSKKFFLNNRHKELFVDETSSEVRKAKSYLFEGTQLHIFVLTRECNQSCIYCQASARNNLHNNINMTPKIAEKAVDIAFQSPSADLTFEFQGGEPLLNFNVLKHIVMYVNKKNSGNSKNITFNLVSNLLVLDDNMLKFLSENNVNISTSIDGHELLHKLNRPSKIPDYYNKIRQNIEKINEFSSLEGSGTGRVSAIQTTTKYSLEYPREIVDAYVSLGFNSIFLRPLTPLGFAKESWSMIGYARRIR